MKRFVFGFCALVTILAALTVIPFVPLLPKRYVPMLSARAPDGTTAAICGYRENLIGEFGADLLIHSATGQLLQKTNLLRSRDAIGDIPAEFFALDYTNNAFQITALGAHYHGPIVFTVSR